MINSEKIGLGIVTYNRVNNLNKLINSLDKCESIIDELIVVNDGDPLIDFNLKQGKLIENESNLGVGKSKNKALKYLYESNCDHLFLIEDDIFIKNKNVFKRYIESSKISGIQHFNYSQHGVMNKSWPSGNANPIMIIDYGTLKIPLYPAAVGAFSYFSKLCIEKAGYFDERYYNACEHVDHTYEIIKKGMHPPFWYNADIENSCEYLEDEPWSMEQSKISSKNNLRQIISKADEIFFLKHGYVPTTVPFARENEVIQSIKQIKKEYGFDINNM